jgi:hypothetical protein
MNLDVSKDELIRRTEAMRLWALNYQIEHAGQNDSENAFFGELDCLVELTLLRAPRSGR